MGSISTLVTFSFLIFQTVKSADVCGAGCHPLVSGKYGVPDTALSASSVWSADHGPTGARLHGSRSWSAIRPGNNEWLQVQFNKLSKVFKVQTQGSSITSQWVTSYIVQTSEDCKVFHDYMENGKTKVFKGNHDQHTVVTNTFSEPVTALCFRIVEKIYHNHPVLRFEVIGKRACPRGYSVWKESCYALVQDLFTWVDADAYCRRGGGSLLTIDSLEEHNWIVGFISKQSPRYTTVENRSCIGKSLLHVKVRSLLLCLHYCRQKTACTAVTTRYKGSAIECWLRSGCHSNELVEERGINTHLMMSRASDAWINLNRVLDHNHWMTEPGVQAKFLHWAASYPTTQFQENCVTITPSFDNKWINKKCEDKETFICES